MARAECEVPPLRRRSKSALTTRDRFCLGDAVHRHPPMNGLGSNTCIQDAANLAWKVALVEKGKIPSPQEVLKDGIANRFMSGSAGKALLDTYTLERQPVGAQVVQR